MRFLAAVALLFSCLVSAQSQTFPGPIGPEHPVTSGAPMMGASGEQKNARVASNGDIALVVWTDNRQSRDMLYGARIDATGSVLDPFGVVIADKPFAASASAVAWNGNAFVVLLGRTLIFINPDMTITDTKTIDLPSTYTFAAASSGSDVRFLFVKRNDDRNSDASVTGAVVDGEGHVASNKELWTNATNTVSSIIVSAGNDSGFLLLRDVRDSENTRLAVTAHRIDANGNMLSSSPSGAPLESALHAMAGGSDGFLVVEASFQAGGAITGYKLDTAGIYHGQRYVIAAGQAGSSPQPMVLPAIVAENGRYVVAWIEQRVAGAPEEWVAELGGDGSMNTRRIGQLTGIPWDVALASNRGHRLVTTSADLGGPSRTDVFVRSLSSSIPGDIHRVTNSATNQFGIEIAAGANGYALIWSENGPETSHFYLRRLSAAGVPQDSAALDIVAPWSGSQTRPRIFSSANGETYLIGWGNAIRRIDARTGQWLDSEPVLLPVQVPTDLASNGTDVLAAANVQCPDNTQKRCLVTIRIPFSAHPPAAPVVSAQLPLNFEVPAIGSNGLDYLVAFTDQFFCYSLCTGGPPWQLYGIRLRSDGTALDAAPLPLDNGKRFPQSPTIASAGGRYLVVWQDRAGVRATRVTAEGAILDRDAEEGGILISVVVTARAEAISGRLAILFSHVTVDANRRPINLIWEGVTFPAEMNLAAAALLPRSVILDTPFPGGLSLSIAPREGLLGVAYTRLGERDTGGIWRVFFRLFGEPSRRRPAAH